MSVTKNNIIKTITKESLVSNDDASALLESFLLLVKKKSKLGSVKLSCFGSFCFKKTQKRLGRNPKTLESYIISSQNKLNFLPSNKIKETLN